MFTGDQGNLSSSVAPATVQNVLSELNNKVGYMEGNPTALPPIQHLHTQVYHRSRVTLRRTRLVQDMSLGLFTPLIALRHHPSAAARATRRRIHEPKALGPDGRASETRFERKLRDTPQGVRYETMVIVRMDDVQDDFKHAKHVTIVLRYTTADQT